MRLPRWAAGFPLICLPLRASAEAGTPPPQPQPYTFGDLVPIQCLNRSTYERSPSFPSILSPDGVIAIPANMSRTKSETSSIFPLSSSATKRPLHFHFALTTNPTSTAPSHRFRTKPTIFWSSTSTTIPPYHVASPRSPTPAANWMRVARR